MPASSEYQSLVAGTPGRPGSPVVLIVNDDADMGEATATNLRREGLRVRTALTSGFALDLCRDMRFDAVVLDHHPADTYSEILLKDTSDMGLAVIVSAAKSDELTSINERYREKVFAVMTEPVTQSELTPVVQAAVTESRRRRGNDTVQDP